MTNDVSTVDQPVTPAEPNPVGELSFTDYQKFRRGDLKIDEASKPAPVEKTEQKLASESEPEETEAVDNEDAEGDEPNESEGQEKPRKKSGFGRRIDKLNSKLSERERELEYWKAEAMKNGATPTPKEEPKVEAAQAEQGKPKAEDFESYSEYTEALTDWKLEQREAKARAESEKSKLMAEQQSRIQAHQQRVKAFADKTEDFQDVVDSLKDVSSVAVEQIILESENGPELLYALAKDPKEAKRICALSPLAAAREMGKLESKIINAATPEPKQEIKKQTSAPKPIDPVGSTKVQVRRSVMDPELSFSDYVELRRDQMKRKGR